MQQLKEELKGQMSEVDKKRKQELDEKRKEFEEMLRNVNDFKRDTEHEINLRKTRLRQQAMENKKKIDIDMVFTHSHSLYLGKSEEHASREPRCGALR